MKYDIFVSYSRRDFDLVKPVVDDIMAMGIRVFFDLTGIESGEEFEEKIIDALDGSDCLLFFYSENSIASEYVKKEVKYFVRQKKRVIPVLFDGLVPKQGWFAFNYGTANCMDISKPTDREKLLNDLRHDFCESVDAFNNAEEERRAIYDEILKVSAEYTWLATNMLDDSLLLQKRIQMQSVSGSRFLHEVIEAMKRNVCISFKYRRYDSDSERRCVIQPYCIKQFKQRWYVLGRFCGTNSKFMCYAMDRVIDLELTEKGFEFDREFDARKYFSEYFGVWEGPEPAERVVIRTWGWTRFSLQDVPMHWSQKIVGEGKDYVDYELFLRITPDFKRQLLNYASDVRVLEPASLADDVRKMLCVMLKRY